VISENEHCGEIPARVSPENKNIGESSHFAGEPDARVARVPQLNSNLVWSAPRETIEYVNFNRSPYFAKLLRLEVEMKGRDSSQKKKLQKERK
jgi:hypothetical protein